MTNTLPETLSLVVERDIPHPPEKVWRALTVPQLIAEWLMKNDFELSIGHRFTLHGEWGGDVACEVRVIQPNRELSYSWDFVNDNPDFDLRSIVTFTLSATDMGTHLRVEQSGFRPQQKQAYGGAKAGWPQLLEKLERTVGGKGGV